MLASRTSHGCSDPDEVLVRAGASGDREAFAVLADRYRPRLQSFVGWYVRSRPDDVEDIVQDVFLQMFRSAPRFEGRSTFRTWLFSIARHVCCGRLRRRGIDLDARPEDDEATAEIPDLRPSALEALESGERQELVRSRLAGLPSHQRVILWLRDRENLSYDEIGVALGVPTGTVRSRLHNARIALGRRLRPILEEVEA